jgi:hypothetical protein
VPLKAQYESADEIPEGLRDYYVQRDGKFVLDLDAADTAPPDGLRKALDSERRVRAEEERRRKAAESQIAELKAQVEAAAKAKPDRDAAGDDLQRQLGAQKKAYDERLAALERAVQAESERRASAEKRLADKAISDTLRSAAIELGIPSSIVDDVVSHPRIAAPWKLSDEGTPLLYDGDQLRYSLKDPSRPMTAAEYLADVAKGYLPPSSGAGARGSSSTPPRGQITLSRSAAKDINAYQRAKEAATKAGQELVITD